MNRERLEIDRLIHGSRHLGAVYGDAQATWTLLVDDGREQFYRGLDAVDVESTPPDVCQQLRTAILAGLGRLPEPPRANVRLEFDAPAQQPDGSWTVTGRWLDREAGE